MAVALDCCGPADVCFQAAVGPATSYDPVITTNDTFVNAEPLTLPIPARRMPSYPTDCKDRSPASTVSTASDVDSIDVEEWTDDEADLEVEATASNLGASCLPSFQPASTDELVQETTEEGETAAEESSEEVSTDDGFDETPVQFFSSGYVPSFTPQGSYYPQNVTVPVQMQNTSVPMQDMNAAMQNMSVPMQNMSVPMQNMNMPMQNMSAPMQNMPMYSMGMPMQNMTAQMQNMGVPTQNMAVPMQGMIAPMQNMGVPNQSMHVAMQMQNMPLPQQNMNTQVQNMAGPYPGLNAPVYSTAAMQNPNALMQNMNPSFMNMPNNFPMNGMMQHALYPSDMMGLDDYNVPAIPYQDPPVVQPEWTQDNGPRRNKRGEKAKKAKRMEPTIVNGSDSCKLFVGGICPKTTTASLRKYFETFGEVVDTIVVVDSETGKCRGFGFVEFKGDIPDGVDGCSHVIDKRTCGVRKYTYSASKA